MFIRAGAGETRGSEVQPVEERVQPVDQQMQPVDDHIQSTGYSALKADTAHQTQFHALLINPYTP